jgi:hypothetical protein
MYAPLDLAIGQSFSDWFEPDTEQRHSLGLRVRAYDPFWGTGDFVYAKAAAAQERGSACFMTHAWVATDIPNTANTGYPIYVSMQAMAQDEYGWYCCTGWVPISTANSVAAGTAFGIAAAGQVGTLANGKQVLGARCTQASTATVTVSGTTRSGSGKILTAGYDGFFVGMALSGTGIPASTVVAGLDPDGKTILTGSAVGTFGDKNATASGTVTITGTWTGYLGAVINNPFVQGQIV